MLRLLGAAIRDGAKKVAATALPLVASSEAGVISKQVRCLSALTSQPQWLDNLKGRSPATSILSQSLTKLLIVPKAHKVTKHSKNKLWIPPRDKVVYFSLKNGKRITNKEVVKRFYRLNWGIWIRTKAGRQKNLWKKSMSRRLRLKHHVFCNSTQSWMLDKMVTKFWKRPKYYVDDPYEPYHTREEFILTQRKPKPLPE